MDWGFVKVRDYSGLEYPAACFAMLCYHCGMKYVEFFPNAKQENLFIGMIHAFQYMGIPKKVIMQVFLLRILYFKKVLLEKITYYDILLEHRNIRNCYSK